MVPPCGGTIGPPEQPATRPRHPGSNDLSHVHPVVRASADIVVSKDEDWGDAAVELQLLLEEDVGYSTTPPVAAGREVFSMV